MFRYSSRFWLYAPTTLFLLLAIAAMVHWWMAADAFRDRLAALKGRPAIPGIMLNWDTVQVSGFPFRLDADFTDFSIKGAGAHGPFSWVSEKFALHALPYGRSQIVYEAAGRQQVSWTGMDGSGHAASFLPASMHASSILDTGGLRRFDLDVLDIGSQAFTIGRFQFHMRRDPDGTDLDLMLRADTMRTRDAKPGTLQIYNILRQARPLGPLLRGEASWPQATAVWRAEGGTAKMSQIIAPGLSADAILSPLY